MVENSSAVIQSQALFNAMKTKAKECYVNDLNLFSCSAVHISKTADDIVQCQAIVVGGLFCQAGTP